MFDFVNLNWWAVLVATVLGFLLGGLWYGPLFGKAWLKAVGKTEDELGKPGVAMGLSFIAQVVSAVGLACLVQALNLNGLGDGIMIGALIGVAFIATAMGSDMAFSGAKPSLWMIQSGYRICYMVIMGVVLAGWR